MIVGFCGAAGSGKDTAADFLVKQDGFVKVALADPLKRICRDIFAFTDDQLWGPSSSRNAPDPRYLRVPGGEKMYDPMLPRTSVTVAEYLTPRYALQRLGTEWGRDCYANVWVDYAIRIAKTLLESKMEGATTSGYHALYYSAKDGLWQGHNERTVKGVVISDVRFQNEISAIHHAGGKVVRLLRGEGLQGAAGQHRSETEMKEIPDTEFDALIDNTNLSLAEFEEQVIQVVGSFFR